MDEKENPDLVRALIALVLDQHDWLRRRAFGNKTSIAAAIRRLVSLAMGQPVVAFVRGRRRQALDRHVRRSAGQSHG